jgi:HD superfamily phosphodiesterase
MNRQAKLTAAMVEHEAGCPRRVGHFLKVWGYAKAIGELEKLDADTQRVLETAAILHDVGIRASLEKYGSSSGKYQEQEGPGIARAMLVSLGFAESVVERVCYLIAHHHTYSAIDGLDYQILVEADFLVNMHEEEMSDEAIRSACEKIFRTNSGKQFCRSLYLP